MSGFAMLLAFVAAGGLCAAALALVAAADEAKPLRILVGSSSRDVRTWETYVLAKDRAIAR